MGREKRWASWKGGAGVLMKRRKGKIGAETLARGTFSPSRP
jgi:hypothetical protein